MDLKRFENFVNDNGELIFMLVQQKIVDRAVSNSTDFVNKLNSERDSSTLEYLLPLVNDFNQHKDLDFIDFWNKTKNGYEMPSNLKSLDGETALKKFFILNKKLRFNDTIKKAFFDTIGVKALPKFNKEKGYITTPDNSRDGSIVTGPNKDNIKFITKKITQHQNRKMY